MNKLNNSDKKALFSFLYKDCANNLYFLSYLNALEDCCSDTAFYGIYEKDELIFAGLISPANACISTRDKSLLPLFSPLVTTTAPARIVGPDEPTLDLINYCPGYIPHPYAYMKLNPGLLPRAKTSFQAKRAGLGDIPELVSFYLKSDFSQNAETRIPQFVVTGKIELTNLSKLG